MYEHELTKAIIRFFCLGQDTLGNVERIYERESNAFCNLVPIVQHLILSRLRILAIY